MAKTIRLRNKSPLEKYVIRQGTKLVFGAFEERVMAADLAQLFLTKFPQDIEKIPEEDFGAVARPLAQSGTVWIANVSGDPDAPDTLQQKERLPRGWATKGSPFFEATIKNPAKNPTDWRSTIGGSQVEYTNASGGLSAYNKPGQTICIPAFRRVELSQYLAEWALSRESGSLPMGLIDNYKPMRIILSRPPQKFEPTMQWELDDLSAYLKLVDPEAPMEESELKIRTRFRKRTESEIATEVDTVKRKVMKRIYFRLVNPKYILPSETEWDEYITAIRTPVINTIEEEQVSSGESKEDLANSIE